jgi:hypothetical protein
LGYQVPAFLVNAALRISGDTPLVIERHRGTIGSILDRLGRQRCRKRRMGNGRNQDAFNHFPYSAVPSRFVRISLLGLLNLGLLNLGHANQTAQAENSGDPVPHG